MSLYKVARMLRSVLPCCGSKSPPSPNFSRRLNLILREREPETLAPDHEVQMKV